MMNNLTAEQRLEIRQWAIQAAIEVNKRNGIYAADDIVHAAREFEAYLLDQQGEKR